MDITKIPIGELLEDRQACVRDIGVCEWALLVGVTEYSGTKSTKYRLENNKKIIDAIDTELSRRKVEEQCHTLQS